MIREYRPETVSWDDLKVLGPMEVEKWEWKPRGFPHEVTIEDQAKTRWALQFFTGDD